MQALPIGQNGVFQPRFPPPFLSPLACDGATSFYDTTPLWDTLGRLVDFDPLNAGDIRASVGAIDLRSGNLVCFDTAERRLRPEHCMVSRALPPGFPAVEIDGEYYWDAGMVSNTPLSRVLTSEPRQYTLTFQVDLWSAKGRLPYDLRDVSSRRTDIHSSSRTRTITNHMLQMQRMRDALPSLLDRLPEPAKQDDDVAAIADLAAYRANNVVHLIYQSKAFEGFSKDYEFDIGAIREHWQSGLDDPETALDDTAETVDGEHGRIETRQTAIVHDVGQLAERRRPLPATTMSSPIRSRTRALSTSSEPTGTSRIASIGYSLELFRGVVMDEDQSRARKDNRPGNLARLRHSALDIIRADQDDGFLLQLLSTA